MLMAFAIDGAAAQAADSAVGKTGAAAVQIESRGVVLAVDDADVTLTRKGDGRPFFSYRAFEAERFQRDLALLRDGGAPDETKGCVRRIKVMPIAWAGVLLSVRQSSQTSCPREAHPADESRFVTFAVSAGGGQKNEDADALKAEAPAAVTPVSLTEWVGEQAVFAALRKDPLVRKALTDAAAPPTTLGVLLNLLIESPPVVGDKRHCYAFPDDLLRR
ncbi:MAG: hypothetical protein ABUR63_11150, partial [Verrucomicrobiota bacterium]